MHTRDQKGHAWEKGGRGCYMYLDEFEDQSLSVSYVASLCLERTLKYYAFKALELARPTDEMLIGAR